MKLTVLGYLGGFPAHHDGTSSYLLTSDHFNLLIDCGSGALLSLENKLNPLELDAVILSHYHADHIADVGVLQYYWQLHEQRPNRSVLPIYGFDHDASHFDQLSWPNSSEGRPYNPNQVLKLGPFDISFLKTQHPVEAYAMRIVERSTGKVLVFTADTRYFSDLVSFSQGADGLMTDTNFVATKNGVMWHMTSTQSGQLARDAQAKQLLLTHLPADQNLTQQILVEAKQAAGDNVKVTLAKSDLIMNF